MPLTLPTIDQFKAQFPADFPYAVPGFGATATAVLVAGTVAGLTLVSGGQGYLQPPVVTITAQPLDPGVGATATTIISAGGVTGFTITNPGAGYVAPPAVSFSQGGGDDTNLKKVVDADIALAIQKASMQDDGSVWGGLQANYQTAFLLLAAHFLVQAVRSRFQGVRGQGGDWLTLSKSVGDVSAN